jgi:hypothetical protein
MHLGRKPPEASVAQLHGKRSIHGFDGERSPPISRSAASLSDQDCFAIDAAFLLELQFDLPVGRPVDAQPQLCRSSRPSIFAVVVVKECVEIQASYQIPVDSVVADPDAEPLKNSSEAGIAPFR